MIGQSGPLADGRLAQDQLSQNFMEMATNAWRPKPSTMHANVPKIIARLIAESVDGLEKNVRRFKAGEFGPRPSKASGCADSLVPFHDRTDTFDFSTDASVRKLARFSPAADAQHHGLGCSR